MTGSALKSAAGARTAPRYVRAVVAGAVVLLAMVTFAARAEARTDVYWVAAVPVTWNVVPFEKDPMMPQTFTAAETVFQTVVYRRYTPGWKRPAPGVAERPGDEQGIQGPLLRARVGDHIVVHFKNMDTASHSPHSMHFHGVVYSPSSDGSYVPGFSGPGADVPPGGSFTYRLFAGPDSWGVWPYHDHSPSMEQSIAGGLYGALSILRPHEQAPDREFVVFLTPMLSFMSIDGRSFLGSTPIFHSRVGDLVQWDVLALGDEFHTFHVHGHRWLEDGVPRDTKTVGPAESFRVRWREESPGTWLYHCHVESHMMNGMIGLYRVSR
ncbi:MAG: multicopper oxidase domain-containing protein [Solirubrobacteraceae bacterium]